MKSFRANILAKVVCLILAAGAGSIVFAANPPAETKNLNASKQEFEGTIRVSGAWALYPMMVKWGEEFQKINPKVRVDVSAGGAGKGIADALSGLVDIGMVSRDIRPEESEKGAFAIAVVKDAVFPTINSANPSLKAVMAKGLKKQAFMDLYIDGKTMTWGDAAGTGAKDPVQVYTRSDSCGAAETWAKYLGKAQEDLKGTAVYGDPGLADAVKKDVNGTGYNNLNFAYDFKTGKPVDGIAIIPIDVNENGVVDPEEKLDNKSDAIKAIDSGKYPSPPARDLNLVTKDKFSGLTLEFIKWILADGQKFTGEVGYINLTPDKLSASKEKLGN
jgi:phosphate transport system substrate-binding protein